MEDTLPKQIEKLNKSEKLLLVEAIWDSIASDPESVPLPEHHKSILDERLKTLDEDTENGMTWDEFKKNYMQSIVGKPFIITPQAQRDFDKAYWWYEEQYQGLGKEFARCLDAKIQRFPEQFQIIYNDRVRRALISRFPYSVFFVNKPKVLSIFAIQRQNRNPDRWKSRA